MITKIKGYVTPEHTIYCTIDVGQFCHLSILDMLNETQKIVPPEEWVAFEQTEDSLDIYPHDQEWFCENDERLLKNIPFTYYEMVYNHMDVYHPILITITKSKKGFATSNLHFSKYFRVSETKYEEYIEEVIKDTRILMTDTIPLNLSLFLMSRLEKRCV